ncbi:MAG TPA: HXXEE domain-containing protein [Thermoanaerobaculia bacterium]|nr:HXXEE domain-containing protein [Thermoanaerobaculia bacterium]
MLLFWLPLAAAALHIVEEFFWPGGFTVWYREYRPEVTKSTSKRFLFWINAALLFGCASVGIDGPTPYGAALFLTMTALLFTNAVFHIRATIRMRRYSPGVITGIALYMPLTIIGYAAILRMRLASPGTMIIAAILGGAYPLYSYAIHTRLSRRGGEQMERDVAHE